MKCFKILSEHKNEVYCLKILIIKLNNKNYFIDQILIGHSLGIIKAIQLKNGDIASSSIDNTIKIWFKSSTRLEKINGRLCHRF